MIGRKHDKIMREILDTLYYLVFVRVGKQYGGEEHPLGPAILVTLLLSVMLISMVLSFVFVLNYWFGVLQFMFFPTWLFYVIVALIILLSYYLFVFRNRYLKVAKRFKSLDERTKKKATLPRFLLFVLNTFSLPIVGYIYKIKIARHKVLSYCPKTRHPLSYGEIRDSR